MSTLKVGAVRGVSASSDAITVANDGSCTANITNNLSNRNLIINGAFQVAQRGTSSTSNGYKTVDRWSHNAGDHGVTVTFSQQSTTSSDTPYQNGFSNFFRIALSGAGTANAAAYAEVLTKLEAQDIANSGWNFKSSSSNITLSFWVRPSTNQTFYGLIRSYDGTAYANAFSFTASGNNTWTKITKTIPGNSNLQFDNNNAVGLQLLITPFYGTDYTNDRALDTWTTFDSANYFPDMASTWLTAGASTFDITGVQLEVGDVATDFEHRSFGQELLRCQRYFVVVRQSTGMCGDSNGSSQVRELNIPIPVAMRATPTVESGITYHMWHGDNGGKNNDGTAMTISSYNNETCLVGVLNGFSGNTDNRTVVAVPNTGAMKISAEL